MSAHPTRRPLRSRALVALVALLAATASPHPATAQEPATGALPLSSPLYGVLGPIARRVIAAAELSPPRDVRFVVIDRAEPNAFAASDTIYVTDALFRFVENREELAGILCHELAHVAANDPARQLAQTSRAATVVALSGALLGANRSLTGLALENGALSLETRRYSRDIELAADARGAATCARAGYNPWGLVWLFTTFARGDAGSRLELLEDHPSQQERIDALEDRFRNEPALYGRFSSDRASATAL